MNQCASPHGQGYGLVQGVNILGSKTAIIETENKFKRVVDQRVANKTVKKHNVRSRRVERLTNQISQSSQKQNRNHHAGS